MARVKELAEKAEAEIATMTYDEMIEAYIVLRDMSPKDMNEWTNTLLDALHAELVALQSNGVDPNSTDDKLFNTKRVYCSAHMRIHSTGWCTVTNSDKFAITN